MGFNLFSEVRKLAKEFNNMSVHQSRGDRATGPNGDKYERLELPVIQSLPVVTPSL